ncbi:MAG: glycosyltransferase family 9 protein [Deltaproteobacteria bacterium]|nr:glycosyltransferase family 9 protein [Deltaproteobacteria bacterium]
MKILIIRYSSLGDVVIATSVIKAIYDRFKPVLIDFLTDCKYIPIFSSNPFINRVIGFDRSADRIAEFLRLKREVDHYDLTLDLQGKVFSALIGRISSPKGYLRFSKRMFWKNYELEHILDQYARFLKVIGVELIEKRYFLFYSRRKGDKVIGINIEGGHISKRLSMGQLFKITEHVTALGFKVVLIGSHISAQLARDIMCRYKNVLDTTSADIKGLIETISGLNVLITPDSGPLHIASALRVPTVAIFGSTPSSRWLPKDGHFSLIASDYDCSPCSDYGTSICSSMKSFGCIRGISADIITSEALRLYESYKEED